VLQYAVKD